MNLKSMKKGKLFHLNIPFSLEIKKGILSFCVLFGFNGL